MVAGLAGFDAVAGTLGAGTWRRCAPVHNVRYTSEAVRFAQIAGIAEGRAQMALARQQRGDWVKSSLSRHRAIGFGPIAFDCSRAAPGLSCAILHDA
jgi:hypothetical protein